MNASHKLRRCPSGTNKKKAVVLSYNSPYTGEAGIEPALTVLETAFLPLEDSPIFLIDANTHPQNRTYKSILLQDQVGHSLSASRPTSCICSANVSLRLLRPWHASMPVRSACGPRFLRFWSSLRPISSSQLHTLLHFHLCPINLVVFKGTYLSKEGRSHLGGGFTLRCLQRLSLPCLATQLWAWRPSWCTRGRSTPVLSY